MDFKTSGLLIIYLLTNAKFKPKATRSLAFETDFIRGTPLSPDAWRKCLKKYPFLKIDTFKLSRNIDLKEKNKYMLYVPFGNFVGLQSYLYDRSKKESWKKERNEWVKQYKELDLFKKVFKSSNILFNSALRNLNIN